MATSFGGCHLAVLPLGFVSRSFPVTPVREPPGHLRFRKLGMEGDTWTDDLWNPPFWGTILTHPFFLGWLSMSSTPVSQSYCPKESPSSIAPFQHKACPPSNTHTACVLPAILYWMKIRRKRRGRATKELVVCALPLLRANPEQQRLWSEVWARKHH